MRYVAGAYPAAPPDDPWNSRADAEFLDPVLGSPLLGGLELPYLLGRLHRADESWLLERLPAGGRHVITTVPTTATRVLKDRSYGLASIDETGRQAALADAAGARDAVERLVQQVGEAAVIAVELHSAPAPAPGAAAALTRSLIELSGWDWSGARPVLEHCDAAGDFPPQKGFLPLEEELQAVAEAGLRVGINWGRSAIERRDIAAPVAHVRQAAERGLLAGLIFSGVSAEASAPHGAWADAHLQPSPLEPASLLDEAAMAETLAAAGTDPDFLGVKLIARSGDRTPAQRAEGLCRSLELLDRAREVSRQR